MITPETIAAAESIIGLEFSDEKRELMISQLEEQERAYRMLRAQSIPNDLPSTLLFDPYPSTFRLPAGDASFEIPSIDTTLPDDDDAIAFLSAHELGELVRTGTITSLRLTEIYLDRLKRYAPALHCVVTLMEEAALDRARRMDEELAAGRWRGPLHGVPYGLKDLFAVRDVPTTWGTPPYRDRVIDDDATVAQRLEAAGAVLVAKLSLGELAYGDVWFGGKTRNPWNVENGSSGSSAGSASATAAGLVGFSIGTETYGSIVSPATTCGVTGLRPTFGRVSRAGGMTLCWSMDKVGPICRSVDDCALVLQVIAGADGRDRSAVDAPFSYTPSTSLDGLRVGCLQQDFDSAEEESNESIENDRLSLETLRELGIEIIPVELPDDPLEPLLLALYAESAAAFDELTRAGLDDRMVRQTKEAWPNLFRAARFIPAVEYIQANRLRHRLIERMGELMTRVDVIVAPSMRGRSLALTNITGHPCVVVPNGFTSAGLPTSITFIGRLLDEGTILSLARRYQEATRFHRRHPEAFRHSLE